MNVSTVANGQYAAHQSCAGNKTSNFSDILQEKLQESQKSSSQKNKWDLSVNVIDYEKAVAEDAARKSSGIPFIMDGDPELKAYVSQLAVELGISKNEKTFQHGLPKWFDFAKDLQELLDEGLISREDIINAVKSPPKVHYNNGYDDKDGFGVELNFDDFENTKPIEYASALELFEMLWGKKASANKAFVSK